MYQMMSGKAERFPRPGESGEGHRNSAETEPAVRRAPYPSCDHHPMRGASTPLGSSNPSSIDGCGVVVMTPHRASHHAREFGKFGVLQVRYGKAMRGSPPKRRNVLDGA